MNREQINSLRRNICEMAPPAYEVDVPYIVAVRLQLSEQDWYAVGGNYLGRREFGTVLQGALAAVEGLASDSRYHRYSIQTRLGALIAARTVVSTCINGGHYIIESIEDVGEELCSDMVARMYRGH